MTDAASPCPAHRTLGPNGIVNLGHEYREGQKYMQYTNSERGQLQRIYYCVFCLKEVRG